MFYRKIDDELYLSLSVPQYAEELFALVDTNRRFLRQWLPWVDSTKYSSDTESFIREQLQNFCNDKALHLSILHREKIVGVLGYNTLDKTNDLGIIGYWLGEDYNGKGIMTSSVQELISVGFRYYSLNRIEIHCATENIKSRAIPERLGFTQEGTRRHAEKVNNSRLDLVIYGLLRHESEL